MNDRAAQSQFIETSAYLLVAMELAKTTWRLELAGGLGGKRSQRTVSAWDREGFVRLLDRARQRFGLPRDSRVVVCQEAGPDIIFDKPFVPGDFLNVGDFVGTVEEIGLKTTRVRALSGEQLVFANADLLGSRIRNYGRMYERRSVFEVGVTYQTPRSLLERVPTTIREAIEEHGDRVRFDRSHLKAFGDSAIVFETVYFVLAPEYAEFMDIQQAVNLRIHERFEEDGIEFAYPTQTLFLVREDEGDEEAKGDE